MTEAHQPAPPPLAADVVIEDLIEALTEMLARRDRAVTALTVVVAEMRADIHALTGTVAALTEPEPPRPNHVCLKVAAGLTGFSAEWLRQCCVAGKVDAHRVGNKWFLNVATLEFANKPPSGKDQA
jgi:hypothetical protein